MKNKIIKYPNQRKYHLKNCEKLFSMGLSSNEIASQLTEACARKKQYWLERGYSDEEAIKMARSKMPGTLEYYTIFKKLSLKVAKKKIIEFQSIRKNTLSNFVKRHGKINGIRLFDIYRGKQSKSNTLEYMIDKYGISAGTKKYLSANKSRAITLENLTKKHGIKNGTERFNIYVKKQRVNGKTKEYFIEKYGKFEGTQFFDEIGKRKSMSYDGFLLRSDGNIELATEKFEEYCKARYNSIIAIRGVSKSSQDFFKKLHNEILHLNISGVYYADFNQEWGCNIIGKRYVYFDFFVKSTGKVIEFNGDYYHANPSKYAPDSLIKIFGETKTAGEIWNNDNDRDQDILTIPYIRGILTIWSSEVQNNEQKIIEKCIKHLIQ